MHAGKVLYSADKVDRSAGQPAILSIGVGATRQNIRSCAPWTTILVGRQDVH
jgi:hypothetical protein